MKHPHSHIIKQWLEDTTHDIEFEPYPLIEPIESNILQTIKDVTGHFKLRIKPKPDEYEHLMHAIRDGKKIEFLRKSDNIWDIVSFNDSNREFTFPSDRYRIHDPYREINEAQEQGKRVVWQNSVGKWLDLGSNDLSDLEEYHQHRYKIVDNDMEFIGTWCQNLLSGDSQLPPLTIKLTKSGIDGTIKAEIIE